MLTTNFYMVAKKTNRNVIRDLFAVEKVNPSDQRITPLACLMNFLSPTNTNMSAVVPMSTELFFFRDNLEILQQRQTRHFNRVCFLSHSTVLSSLTVILSLSLLFVSSMLKDE